MAIIEKSGFLKYKDASGNTTLMYPITTKDNVDGMDDIDAHVASQENPHNVTADQIEAISYSAQSLTDEQKAQARTNIGAGTSDVTSWNELQDKPVVMAGTSDTLTWDGNTEGRVWIEALKLAKVSDVILYGEELARATIRARFSEEIEYAPETNNVDFPTDGVVMVMCSGILAVLTVSENMAGQELDGIAFPEAGTYLAYGIDGDGFISSLTIPGYTGFGQEKIAPSHLYQPDWNQNDETAADFIKNKPFGELPTGSDTLYWDGNREGLVRANDYEQYLISESTPTMDDFANGASNTKLDGDTETSTNLGLNTSIYEVGDGAIVVGNSIVALKDGATVGDTIYPKKGTYFTWIGNDCYTTSLTIPGYDGFPSSKLLDEKWLPKHNHQIGPIPVTTAGSGAEYTVTVDGITALEAGISFTMIPHTASTSKTATLNVNGLGAKMLRRPLSTNNTTTVANATDNWMYANKPVEVMYNGTYWIVTSMPRPNGPDIYGTVPVSAGGVPSATTADNGKFLRVVDGTPAWVAIGNAEEASF